MVIRPNTMKVVVAPLGSISSRMAIPLPPLNGVKVEFHSLDMRVVYQRRQRVRRRGQHESEIQTETREDRASLCDLQPLQDEGKERTKSGSVMT